MQSYPEVEYYTMCRDGKWGLMRSDGTEVLPCRASGAAVSNAVSATPTIGTGTLDDLFVRTGLSTRRV